jgi:hypothetical protein
MDDPPPSFQSILHESDAIDDYLDRLMQLTSFRAKFGVRFVLAGLLERLVAVHGRVEAHRLLALCGGPQEKNDINRMKGWALLERYDAMPVKNVRGLARQIYDENAKLPDDNQLTPRPKPTLPTIESYLRELLRQRREECEAGTWRGPVDRVNGPFPVYLPDDDL